MRPGARGPLLPFWLLHPFESLGLPWFLRPSKLGAKRSLVVGFTLGFSLSLSLTGLALYALDAWRRSLRRAAAKRTIEIRGDEVIDGVEGLIGASLTLTLGHDARLVSRRQSL